MSAEGRRPLWALLGLCGLAGAATVWAFAPSALAVLAVAGPAAGLWAASRARTAAGGALCGIAWGLGFGALLFRWALELHPAAYAALPVVQALFWAIPGAVAARASRLAPAWWAVCVVAAWTLAESLRARLPLGGFEWGQLGLTTAALPVRQAAAVVGTLGVTALVAALAAGVVVAVSAQGRRRWIPLTVGAVATVALTGLGVVPWTTATTDLRVGVVQVDDPCPEEFAVDCPGHRDQLRSAFMEGAEALPDDLDVILWGEGALGGGSPEDIGRALAQDMDGLPAPVLAGTTSPADGDRWWNRNVLYRADGTPLGAYAKRHPVPFGEYVPLRGWLGGIGDVGRLVPRDMARGDGPQPIPVPGEDGTVSLSTVVSWEVAFSRLVRDAARHGEALATLTTQASYGTASVSDQLLGAAQLRAAESQRAMVVAATTGRSAVITPDGQRHETTVLYGADSLTATLPGRSGMTPFLWWGDVPVVALSVAALAFVAVRERRDAAA